MKEIIMNLANQTGFATLNYKNYIMILAAFFFNCSIGETTTLQSSIKVGADAASHLALSVADNAL